MEFEKFNKSDLKTIKKDYLSNIMPTTGIFLLLILMQFIYFSLNGFIGYYFIISIAVSLGLSYLCFLIITRKHRLDLINQRVELSHSIIKNKVYKKVYEPGSATVPVNFYSLLFFKKIFLREMKELNIYYLLVDETKVFVQKEDYEKFDIEDKVVVRWSENTQLFLGIIKDDKLINLKKTSRLNRIYI